MDWTTYINVYELAIRAGIFYVRYQIMILFKDSDMFMSFI